jgi:ArsR family metal-binding transcriptional regulator
MRTARPRGDRAFEEEAMLLRKYTLEIVNNHCMPGAMSVQCIARLHQDVSQALPYLNAELGGFEYIREPASVTFKIQGRLVAVHGDRIAVNALRDENEARKIVEWLKREINGAWAAREKIQPKFEGLPRPGIIDILKLLPKTNCRKCGEPTCMVFAVRLADGARAVEACPELTLKKAGELSLYLGAFPLDGETDPWDMQTDSIHSVKGVSEAL